MRRCARRICCEAPILPEQLDDGGHIFIVVEQRGDALAQRLQYAHIGSSEMIDLGHVFQIGVNAIINCAGAIRD